MSNQNDHFRQNSLNIFRKLWFRPDLECVYTFESQLYLWSAQDNWYFVNLPESISAEIREVSAPFRRGFGSVRVDVTCGTTNWRTSVFPDSKVGCYILPVKALVRKREHLAKDTIGKFEIELVDC